MLEVAVLEGIATSGSAAGVVVGDTLFDVRRVDATTLRATHKSTKRMVQLLRVMDAGALGSEELLNPGKGFAVYQRLVTGAGNIDTIRANNLTDIERVA